MSAQILSDRSVRRIARKIDQPVLRAWGHGGYIHRFVTTDHRHGWVDITTWEWGWDRRDPITHYSSCKELFG